MSAKKSEPAAAEKAASASGGLATLMRGNARWLTIVAIVVVGSVLAWGALWERVRDHVVGSADYRLDPQEIEITPPPAWIHAPLKAEVIRDASLDSSLSILDPELTVTIAHAFGLHPWVAKVERVSKRAPAGVKVDLVYRRPVAMVEVPGPALLPVDIEGVLLPTEDFSPADASNYPRIAEIKTSPLGPVGTRWGDTHVAGAARVAADLLDHWDKLKLHHVVAAGRLLSAAGSAETDAYEIFTKTGTRIDWGRPPGAEIAGEPKCATKINWLLDYAAKHADTLDDETGPQRFDVRNSSGMVVAPRPPIQALPKSAKAD